MTTTAHARNSDPANSHLAAESVQGITELQQRILACFEDSMRGLTDEELIVKYKYMWGIRNPATDSSLRTRRSDLVTKGHLYATSSTRLTYAGRESTVWGISGVLF